MSINYQIHNIFHTILSKQNYSINVLYTYTTTLFDKIMQEIPGSVMINNQVFLNTPISYGLCIINDPLDFAQNLNVYGNLFANKVLLFHDRPSPSLKKEDLFLLKASLNRFPSFCFDPDYESWMNPNIIPMNYGIKETNISIQKEKDIILLSPNNHKQTKLIYDNLKQSYPSTDLVTVNTNESYDNILELISKYKICIDLGSYYNVLCGVSVGCYGITTKKSHKDNYINYISDYGQLISIVNSVLSATDINIPAMQRYIKDKYPYDNFINNMKNIITNNSEKAILL